MAGSITEKYCEFIQVFIHGLIQQIDNDLLSLTSIHAGNNFISEAMNSIRSALSKCFDNLDENNYYSKTNQFKKILNSTLEELREQHDSLELTNDLTEFQQNILNYIHDSESTLRSLGPTYFGYRGVENETHKLYLNCVAEFSSFLVSSEISDNLSLPIKQVVKLAIESIIMDMLLEIKKNPAATSYPEYEIKLNSFIQSLKEIIIVNTNNTSDSVVDELCMKLSSKLHQGIEKIKESMKIEPRVEALPLQPADITQPVQSNAKPLFFHHDYVESSKPWKRRFLNIISLFQPDISGAEWNYATNQLKPHGTLLENGTKLRRKDPEHLNHTKHSFIIIDGNILALTHKTLGVGASGRAKLAMDNHGGLWAVKIMPHHSSAQIPEAEKDRVEREANILKHLHLGFGQAYRGQKKYVASIFLGQTLANSDIESLSSQIKCKLAIQLLQKTHDLHTGTNAVNHVPFIHGDIRPINITIDKNQNLHLIDFGTSYPLSQDDVSSIERDIKMAMDIILGYIFQCQYVYHDIPIAYKIFTDMPELKEVLSWEKYKWNITDLIKIMEECLAAYPDEDNNLCCPIWRP